MALPDFSTASMNAMTRVPVTASGANSDAAFGERDSSLAVTRSAKSVYSCEKASMNPSGWPPGSADLCPVHRASTCECTTQNFHRA